MGFLWRCGCGCRLYVWYGLLERVQARHNLHPRNKKQAAFFGRLHELDV
jgi:hypothetical protein